MEAGFCTSSAVVSCEKCLFSSDNEQLDICEERLPIQTFTNALIYEEDVRTRALVCGYSDDFRMLSLFYVLAREHGDYDLTSYIALMLGVGFGISAITAVDL